MVVCKAYFQNVPRMRNEKREERREKREERRKRREKKEEREEREKNIRVSVLAPITQERVCSVLCFVCILYQQQNGINLVCTHCTYFIPLFPFLLLRTCVPW
jgi:hypothetical protein